MTYKFRGIKIDGSGWVYGSYVANIEWAKWYIYYPVKVGEFIQLTKEEVIPESVGQFTRLLDKDGKEVFEGDIITAPSFNPTNYEIKFVEGAFVADYSTSNGWCLEMIHFSDSTGIHYSVTSTVHDHLLKPSVKAEY